jgi:uncharacterized protein (TIGR02300 family)
MPSGAKGFDLPSCLWQLARNQQGTQARGIPMPKEDWGTKRVCPTTGKRFYDMNKRPIVSPYTGEVVELEVHRGRMIAADAEDGAIRKAKANVVENDDDVLDDEDVDIDLDDELLEEEDDDNVSLDDLTDVAAEDEEI